MRKRKKRRRLHRGHNPFYKVRLISVSICIGMIQVRYESLYSQRVLIPLRKNSHHNEKNTHAFEKIFSLQ